MTKVLVTGGAGFIGSNLAQALLKKGFKVIIVDNLFTGKRENIPSGAKFYKLDIVSQKLSSLFLRERPKIVFHLAALTGTDISEALIQQDIKINLLGTINTLKAAGQAKCQKFIFTSTAAVYGDVHKSEYLPIPETAIPNPISPYGVGKLTCENYVRIFSDFYGMKYTILRFANVFGPKQYPKGEAGVIPIFINKMLSGKTSNLYGDGNQIRDYIFVEDVVDASLKVMTKCDGKTLNIGSGKGTSTRQLYSLIARQLDFRTPPNFSAPRLGEIERSVLANKLAKREINWRPRITLKTGLCRTIEWWRNKKSL
jgi:UDP-glucose 4-epimerase